MNATVGLRLTLAEDHGNAPGSSNPAFHPDGQTNSDGTITLHPLPDGPPLAAGAVGTVVAIVPAAEDGAGNNEEDHAVLDFDGRYVSFTEAQLSSLFAHAPAQEGVNNGG